MLDQSLSSENHNSYVSIQNSCIKCINYTVDGKQVIGHHVLRGVVEESEEEMLHVFKEMTIDQYQLTWQHVMEENQPPMKLVIITLATIIGIKDRIVMWVPK